MGEAVARRYARPKGQAELRLTLARAALGNAQARLCDAGRNPGSKGMSGQEPGPRTAAPWGAQAARKTESSTERSAKFSAAGGSNLLPAALPYPLSGARPTGR